jgi:ferric-dicitrate binding protein FerR (iron transport regulator)
MSKFVVAVEHASGERFNLSAWRKSVLKGQDMEAWRRENPEEFKRNVAAWVKGQLVSTIENLDVVVREL